MRQIILIIFLVIGCLFYSTCNDNNLLERRSLQDSIDVSTNIIKSNTEVINGLKDRIKILEQDNDSIKIRNTELNKQLDSVPLDVNKYSDEDMLVFLRNYLNDSTITFDTSNIKRKSVQTIVIDLKSYSIVKELNVGLSNQIEVLERINITKDSLIDTQNSSINQYEKNDSNYKSIIKLTDKENKSLKRQVGVYKTISILTSVGLLTILLVK
jgi:hypothetical protein